MGAPYIDYVLADRTAVPRRASAVHSKRVVSLPDTYQSNEVWRRPYGIRPRRCGLPETGFVFCSLQRRLQDRAEDSRYGCGVCRALPGSVLWLIEDNEAASRNLRREAETRGVGPTGSFRADAKPEEHLARHRLADLFLDTLPYAAHTTARDAL